METIESVNSAQNYNCELCDIKCSKKNDWERHILTAKHKRKCGKKTEMKILPKNYTCKCGKIYETNSGLWKHVKTCKGNIEIIYEDKQYSIIKENPDIVDVLINENKEFKNVIIDLLKNNSDLQKQMMEVCQKIQPTTNNNINNTNNINSHNKNFNLNFFLNEQCKDAMNIMDFVNTFQLQFSDFERIGEVGYVEGISKIIIDKLSKMDIYKRPIHCSDAKREIMYVKDKDVWEKENATNSKIRLAVRHITKKNSDMVRPWAIKYPNALNGEHHLSDTYQIMVIEAMGGNSGTMEECENKIIKKISKMVLIDKR